jgi:anti-sigma regulatory factor (Ser/Thr protein kinase)
MADDVALCVSELVSNAVEHAVASGNPLVPHQVVLGLRYFASSCLFVEVGDCDPRPPLLPAPAADDDPLDLLAVSGRGLVIVGELADAVWWTRRAAGGKYVYARLDTPRYFDGERELCDE